MWVKCIDNSGFENNLTVGNKYKVHGEDLNRHIIIDDMSRMSYFKIERFVEIFEDNIKPKHYNKGDIDLYESWYLTRPFNEFRAIMESMAERYMKRDKLDRLEDLDKCMETLRRLREYEVRHKEEE